MRILLEISLTCTDIIEITGMLIGAFVLAYLMHKLANKMEDWYVNWLIEKRAEEYDDNESPIPEEPEEEDTKYISDDIL